MDVAWAGLEEKLAQRAALRKLDDLSIGPVLTWTTDAMLAHVDKLLEIPGTSPLLGHEHPFLFCTFFVQTLEVNNHQQAFTLNSGPLVPASFIVSKISDVFLDLCVYKTTEAVKLIWEPACIQGCKSSWMKLLPKRW